MNNLKSPTRIRVPLAISASRERKSSKNDLVVWEVYRGKGKLCESTRLLTIRYRPCESVIVSSWLHFNLFGQEDTNLSGFSHWRVAEKGDRKILVIVCECLKLVSWIIATPALILCKYISGAQFFSQGYGGYCHPGRYFQKFHGNRKKFFAGNHAGKKDEKSYLKNGVGRRDLQMWCKERVKKSKGG